MASATSIKYQIEGNLTFDCDAPTQDVHDLFRRCAAIMASHLFYNPEPLSSYNSPSETSRRIMSSHVASHLYRLISEEAHKKPLAVKIPKDYSIPLKSKNLVMIPKTSMKQDCYSGNPSDVMKIAYHSSDVLQGCIELGHREEFFVVVKYQISIVSQPHNGPATDCKFWQEAHHSWFDMIKAVLDAHNNHQANSLMLYGSSSGSTRCFSGSIADKALCQNPRRSFKYL